MRPDVSYLLNAKRFIADSENVERRGRYADAFGLACRAKYELDNWLAELDKAIDAEKKAA